MSRAMVHPKERCTSCGVWRDKRSDCYFCTKNPTRLQALAAQQRRGSQADLRSGRSFSMAGMHALKDGGRKSLAGLESVAYTVDDTPKFAGGGGMLG